jgi:nitrite reductase/ring-hydroxylating ferredoxin subunit
MNCPHCRSPIDTIADSDGADILCPCCGSNFRVDRDQTQCWDPGAKQISLGKFELQ